MCGQPDRDRPMGVADRTSVARSAPSKLVAGILIARSDILCREVSVQIAVR